MIRIIMLLICFHLSYCSQSSSKVDKEADKIFFEEMISAFEKVQNLKRQVQEMRQGLSVWNYLNVDTVFQFWNWFSKIKHALWAIQNAVFKRDNVENKLKRVERSLNIEGFLIHTPPRPYETSCAEALKHPFFKKAKWTYIENTSVYSSDEIIVKTADRYLRRKVKICYASSPSNKKFQVFISPAFNFDWEKNFAFFVFTRDDQHYKVSAYLVKN